MTIVPGLDLLLQSRPPTPGEAALLTGTLVVLVGLRVIFAPVLYLVARHSKGAEVWWGALAVLSPAVAAIAYILKGRPARTTGSDPWNPWVLCPFCGSPRGYSALPCPRCGQPLPPVPPGWPSVIPALAPPKPEPRPAPGLGYGHVVGALAFIVLLASAAGFLMVVPLVTDPVTAQAELTALLEEPWFILATVVVQDAIMMAVAFDQAVGRGRLTWPQVGFRLSGLAGSFPKMVALGLGAGVLTFVFTATTGQILFDTLKAFGMSQSQEPLPGQPVIHSTSDFVFWLIAGVVVAPLAEETFFRGFALGGLASRGLQNRGLLFTSLLFAAIHFNPLFFGQLLAAGLILGALYLRTGSLVAPIVAHMTNNFIVTTAILFGM